MGWGTAGGALAAAPAEDDHELVAAIRDGDDRAFEALYERYHRRIAAYAASMLKDHGRAEDVTQEVFVSALRRMRTTDRPIAFKPWVYEIARNACIDQYRRTRHVAEVPLDGEEGVVRLAADGPTPDAAVAAKQDLDDLCGAFGGLSDTHHEILLLRELEGLSYREIGERLNMSRPAVESTLFRARRRLAEEYDELVTGARCTRVQGVIEAAATAPARLGARDSRRLAHHVSHCTSCRRTAVEAGVDPALLVRVPLRRRLAARVAGLLPLPGFARLGRGGADAPIAAGGGGSRWVAELPAIADGIGGGGWGKVATMATVVVAGIGASGVGTHDGRGTAAQERDDRRASPGRRTRSGPRRTPASACGTRAATATAAGATAATRRPTAHARARAERHRRAARRARRRPSRPPRRRRRAVHRRTTAAAAARGRHGARVPGPRAGRHVGGTEGRRPDDRRPRPRPRSRSRGRSRRPCRPSSTRSRRRSATWATRSATAPARSRSRRPRRYPAPRLTSCPERLDCGFLSGRGAAW